MATQEIEITKNTLTNIQNMIPLLDEEGRKAASAFLFGLTINRRKKSLDSNEPKKVG